MKTLLPISVVFLLLIQSEVLGQVWCEPVPIYCYPPVIETVVIEPAEIIPPRPKVRRQYHFDKDDVVKGTKIDIRTPDGHLLKDVWVLNGYLPQISTDYDKWGRATVLHFYYGAKIRHDGHSTYLRYSHIDKGRRIIKEQPRDVAPAPTRRSKRTRPRDVPVPAKEPVPSVPRIPDKPFIEDAPAPSNSDPILVEPTYEDDAELFRDIDG